MNERIIRFRVWDKLQNRFITNYKKMHHEFGLFNRLVAIYGGASFDEKNFILQQYIGFIDTDGTPIFEGDLVADTEFGVVQKRLMGDIRHLPNRYLWNDENSQLKFVKVLGNVLETPSYEIYK